MVAYGCPHGSHRGSAAPPQGCPPRNKKSTTGQAMGTTQRCNLADDEILGRSAKGELTDDSGGDRHARLLFVLRLPECLVSSETVISAAQLRLRPPPSSRHALKPMTSTTLLSSTMRSIAPEFGPQVATTLLVCAAQPRLLSPRWSSCRW